MISSPISLVLRSRSADSMTKVSASFTICSSLLIGTGRFSQARISPLRTFWRSKRSRRRRAPVGGHNYDGDSPGRAVVRGLQIDLSGTDVPQVSRPAIDGDAGTAEGRSEG